MVAFVNRPKPFDQSSHDDHGFMIVLILPEWLEAEVDRVAVVQQLN